MDEVTKYCQRCSQTKPISEWVRNRARSDGLSGYCHSCQAQHAARNRRELRHKVVVVLGGCCVRCAFTDERALQVDHVNGGGIEDRGRNTNGFYKKVLADADDRYQLLCANCNVIKRHETGEFRPASSYTRVPPTEYTPTQGKGPWSDERKARYQVDLAGWIADHPEEWTERNRKISEGNRGKPRPKANSLSAAQITEVMRLRSEGITQAVIAGKFGVSQPLISKLVKQNKGN